MALLLSGCSSSDATSDGSPDGSSTPGTAQDAGGAANSAFADDIAIPLSSSCTPCHGSAASGGLVLSGISEAALKSALVNVPSTEAPDMVLVAPGNPDASYLYLKLNGNFESAGCGKNCGSKMPLTGSYPGDKLSALETWIKEGAK